MSTTPPGPLTRKQRAKRAFSLSKLSHALAAVLGIIVATGVSIVIDAGPDHHIVTVHVGKPATVTTELGGPGNAKVALPPAAQAVAATQSAQAQTGGAESGLHDTTPLPPAVVANDKKIAPPGQPVPPAHVPLASVHQAGCRTLQVRNQSSRAGSPTLLGVLHQTISPDNGWSGVLGVVRWFDESAAQASSNYVVARTGGQCAYIVPESSKAWAQAGFNSVAVSAEVTETGREGSYLVGAGKARVLQLMRGWHKRWGIPYRHGRVSGCSVVRAGFVEHADLGACGGGHHDDNPPCNSACLDQLIAEAAAGDRPKVKITAADRRRCAAVKNYRLHTRHKRRFRHYQAARLSTLKTRGLTCRNGQPVRR